MTSLLVTCGHLPWDAGDPCCSLPLDPDSAGASTTYLELRCLSLSCSPPPPPLPLQKLLSCPTAAPWAPLLTSSLLLTASCRLSPSLFVVGSLGDPGVRLLGAAPEGGEPIPPEGMSPVRESALRLRASKPAPLPTPVWPGLPLLCDPPFLPLLSLLWVCSKLWAGPRLGAGEAMKHREVEVASVSFGK